MTLIRRFSLAASLVLAVAGCPDETTSTSDPLGATTPSAKATGSGTATPSGSASSSPGEVAIKPRAKDALDGKEPDASHQGATLSATGAKGVFTVVEAWAREAGDVGTAIQADEKARMGMSAYTAGEDTQPKVDALTKKLGLTACRWGETSDVTLGKDKLATQVADGVCQRDKTVTRAIRAVTTDEKTPIVAIGAWDDGSDDKTIVSTFLSLAESGGQIAKCCDALAGNMATAPPTQKPAYGLALVFCRSAMASPDGRKILAQVRGKLGGATIPAACQ